MVGPWECSNESREGGISRLTEDLLASEEGLSFMELVS